jgi:hypothetical protein
MAGPPTIGDLNGLAAAEISLPAGNCQNDRKWRDAMSISTIAARFGGVSLAVALLLGPGVVWADSPHFISATETFEADGDLFFKWKEAGLGQGTTIEYDASATVTVTCNCVTHSGSCPSAANKVTGTTNVSVPATFTSSKGGSINGSVTLEAPNCPTSKSPTCGGGQTLKLSAIDWTNISLFDTLNNISAGVAPSQSATFFTCP